MFESCKRAPLEPLTVCRLRIGLGCMGMSAFYGATDEAEAIATIHRALELGCTFLDTAEIYGPLTNEELRRPGDRRPARRRHASRRSSASASRRPPDNPINRVLDGSPENVRRSIEGSLKRLGTDHVDLYYQHRVDPDDADRGDRRRDGRARRRGQGPPHRAVGGERRDDPPRARRAPDHRAADRVLAVDARPRGRAPRRPAASWASASSPTRRSAAASSRAASARPTTWTPTTSAATARASAARTSSAT